ncbi:hypothetical protein EYW49_17355 [Siculibacillus lacustris]|uniref:LysE family translocator n=1 Tax=Siculibacillus lacustris TaxID=1549641 RepID=A0A4Q9VI49_9HYPH|nr:hypothetical protein [Siculibacillus lacustris]TBW34867.1 hypothetical protein EYW49_17355 [Siculibacillus lacustris]
MPQVLVSLLGVVAILATPGPTNTLLAAAGATSAGAPPWRLVGAELAGYLVSIALLRTLGAPLAAAIPFAVPTVKLALAAYLAALGAALWRHDAGSTDPGPITPRRLFVATLFNPKAAVFAFALFPDSVERPQIALWVAGFALAVALCGGGWLLLGRRAGRDAGTLVARLVPRLASVVLVGFGLALAATTLAKVV